MTEKKQKKTRVTKPVDPEEEYRKRVVYYLEIICSRLGYLEDKLEILCNDVRRNQ